MKYFERRKMRSPRTKATGNWRESGALPGSPI